MFQLLANTTTTEYGLYGTGGAAIVAVVVRIGQIAQQQPHLLIRGIEVAWENVPIVLGVGGGIALGWYLGWGEFATGVLAAVGFLGGYIVKEPDQVLGRFRD